MSKDWQWCLDRGYTVTLDNDTWWFTKYSVDEDEVIETVCGGKGPYGQDLLIYLLEKHYSGVDFV